MNTITTTRWGLTLLLGFIFTIWIGVEWGTWFFAVAAVSEIMGKP